MRVLRSLVMGLVMAAVLGAGFESGSFTIGGKAAFAKRHKRHKKHHRKHARKRHKRDRSPEF
jgi:hypothetical protein